MSRECVREYTGEAVDKKDLDAILKAASASPVGMGLYDDVHLTVIENKELLAAIDKACAEMFNDPESHPLYGVPTLVVVSGKKPAPGMENVTFSNGAIIAHTMVLEATDLGDGACYIWGAMAAASQSADIMKKMDLPEGFIPCCAVAIGKTNVKYAVRDIPEERIARTVIK
jgi:nitroreductase